MYRAGSIGIIRVLKVMYGGGFVYEEGLVRSRIPNHLSAVVARGKFGRELRCGPADVIRYGVWSKGGGVSVC